MKTQLRVVVEGFMVLPVVVFSVNDVHKASPVTVKAVKSYLTFLVNDGVLICNGCMYHNGPNANDWLKQTPKTKLGGHSRHYLAIRRLRINKPISQSGAAKKAKLLPKLCATNSWSTVC